MKLIKLPVKIILLPIIAIIFLVCKLIKVLTHLSCYIVGPGMLLILFLIIIMAMGGRWKDCLIFGSVGAGAFLTLFLITVIVCHVEDLNEHLVNFVRS